MAILKERTFALALFAKIPNQEPVDRGFKECCFELLVLADVSSSKVERNDYSGFYFQKQSNTDDCTFVLVEEDNTEHTLNDDTYGQFVDFGDVSSNSKLTYFVVDWKKVLIALGPQKYQVKKELIIAGVSVDIFSNNHTLKQYTNELANNTVRLDILMNGYLKKENVDFADSNFTDSIRFDGFFGNSNPEYTEKLYTSRNKNKQLQNDMSVQDVWVLQSSPMPDCISKKILYFMLLSNEIFMNDYNANNHRYDLTRIPVKLDTLSGIDYFAQIRDARLNLTFRDRYLDNEKTNC